MSCCDTFVFDATRGVYIEPKVGNGKCDEACLACNEVNGRSEVANELLLLFIVVE